VFVEECHRLLYQLHLRLYHLDLLAERGKRLLGFLQGTLGGGLDQAIDRIMLLIELHVNRLDLVVGVIILDEVLDHIHAADQVKIRLLDCPGHGFDGHLCNRIDAIFQMLPEAAIKFERILIDHLLAVRPVRQLFHGIVNHLLGGRLIVTRHGFQNVMHVIEFVDRRFDRERILFEQGLSIVCQRWRRFLQNCGGGARIH
jgi:hypothetical protein